MTVLHFLLSATALSMSVAGLARAGGFDSAMNAAMTRMHGAMMIGRTGNPDRDFAATMIPHHQGAIDMARLELRFGKDERLRRLAQGIIVEQQQEIEVMRRILLDHKALPHRIPAPSRVQAHLGDY